MFSRFSHNWTLKLTALLLSIAVWSHVRGQVNPWETATFKARLKVEAPRGYMLLNAENLPKTVVVTLRGPRLTLRGLKGPAPANPLATEEDAPLLAAAQLSGRLDFSNPRKGQQSVSVKAVADIEDIEVVGAKPGELSVVLDAAETRQLEIEPQILVGDELEIEDVNLSASRARISGPSKQIDLVQGLRVRVSRSRLQAGVLRLERVPVEALDEDGDVMSGVPIEPAFVNLEIKSRERQSSKTVRVAAKVVGTPGEEYQLGRVRVEPSRITLRGPRRALDAINSLSAEVDVSDASSDIDRRVRLDLPRGVEAVTSRRVRVRVEVTSRGQSTPAAPATDPTPIPLAPVPAPAAPSPEPIN